MLLSESIQLLEQSRLLNRSKAEMTLLNIGGKGYYENPSSELLRFFLIPNNEHGLGHLFADALREVLVESGGPDLTELIDGNLSVAREVATPDGKRIDLAVRSSGLLLLIENKIWHHQNNPFQSYEGWAGLNKLPDDKVVFAVLSPSGESARDGWVGVGYNSLIASLEERLNARESEFSSSKWWHFARDFVTHLKQELYGNPMNQEEINFVENNYERIEALAKLQQSYKNHLAERLPKLIEQELGPGASSKVQGWCIRLFHTKFNSSNIAWWNDWKSGYGNKLSVYMDSITPEELVAAKKSLEPEMHYWEESNGRWSCWKSKEAYPNREAAEKGVVELAEKVSHVFHP